MTINTFLRKRRGENKGSLIIRYYLNTNEYCDISLHKIILVSDWDQDTKKVINRRNAGTLNQKIEVESDKIARIYFSYYKEYKIEPSPKRLKELYKTHKDVSTDLIEFLDAFVRHKASGATNRKRMVQVLKKFTEGEQYAIADITADFAHQFMDFLLSEDPSKSKKPYSHSTVKLIYGRFCEFVDWCVKKRYMPHQSINFRDLFKDNNLTIKCKRKPIPTLAEVNEVIELDLHTLEVVNDKNFELYSLVKDLFVFSCSSGLRISDLVNLHPNEVIFQVENGEKIVYLEIKEAQKDKDKIVVLLDNPGVCEEIYNKNKNDDFVFPLCKRYPTITNYNKYLKSIFKALGFTRENKTISYKGGERIVKMIPLCKGICMHVGRDYFATNYLDRGGDIYTLSRVLGHSSVQTTEQHYVQTNTKKMLEKQRIVKSNSNGEVLEFLKKLTPELRAKVLEQLLG